MMRNRITSYRLRTLLSTLGLLALMCAGCNTLKKGVDNIKQEPPEQLPQFINRPTANAKPVHPNRMAVIWTDAVYAEPGKPTTRGFGGRIYFYDRHHQSVPVDGELTVYAYDDSTQDTGMSKVPKRKFVFPAEKLALHYSKTDLGHSYSVWLPWDAVGGELKEVSLVPVYRNTTNGMVVKGEQSKNVLPGSKPSSVEGLADRRNRPSTVGTLQPIRPANYRPEDGFAESPVETTTINLSPNLKRQLQAAPVAATFPNTSPSIDATTLSQRTMADNAQISYGGRPQGWNETTITSQPITKPKPMQRRPAAFGSPGNWRNQRYANSQPVVANAQNATEVYPPSVHSGQPISPVQGVPNSQQVYGNFPNQPFPSTPQYGQSYAR